jgi:predicted dehydrogenase
MAGDIREIYCQLTTFDKGIGSDRIGEYVLDAHDSLVATVTFANGAQGALHASRWATGQMNTLCLRVFGDRGAVDVDLDRSGTAYRICKGRANRDAACWETVDAKPHPQLHQQFVRAIRTGRNPECDFGSACKIQAYLHSSVLSHTRRAPVKVTRIP